jgi:hypothetical protein
MSPIVSQAGEPHPCSKFSFLNCRTSSPFEWCRIPYLTKELVCGAGPLRQVPNSPERGGSPSNVSSCRGWKSATRETNGSPVPAMTSILVNAAFSLLLISSGEALLVRPPPDGEPAPECIGVGEKPVCMTDVCGGMPIQCVCSGWACKPSRSSQSRNGVRSRDPSDISNGATDRASRSP